MKNGASINEVDDRDKFTPLHTACNTGALEVGYKIALLQALQLPSVHVT